MEKIQRILTILGFTFMFSYVFIYVGEISTSPIFKYLLVIGFLFLTVDFILFLIIKFKSKK
ncbi:hypothetical protein J2S19_004621 [Metabacillus malikii]|uniref:DUF4305 domain-containing protein n=1 Tax=Metabacillus malikii TaxID=1504265 RepID=A0ABT9ZLZ4_9BACI|nr:hypothetical protein [Metabacillus malikii]